MADNSEDIDGALAATTAAGVWRSSRAWRRLTRLLEDAVRAIGRRLIPTHERNRLVRRFPWLRRRDGAPGVGAPLPMPPAAAVGLQRRKQPSALYDVICLAVIEWPFRFQRPQQLAQQFAEHGHRVFYISPEKMLSPAPARAFAAAPLLANVWDVRLALGREWALYRQAMGQPVIGELAVSLDALRRAHGIHEAVCLVQFPSWAPLALELRRRYGWRIVYDCMDDWRYFHGVQSAALGDEEELARSCDLMIVTAQSLFDRWRGENPRLMLARNAVNAAFFAQGCAPNDLLADAAHPILGYYGAIAAWFDVALVREVALRRPGWVFVLLGGVFDVDVAPLQALPNVRMLGDQPYETMPAYLYHFDVCIVPFIVNDSTRAMDLVKLYEFMSAGKPVVSTPLPELASYADCIYLASDADSFMAQIEEALRENDPALPQRRRALAHANTWEERYAAINAAIAALHPQASLIIVAYNNEALTRQCIESIYRNTGYPSFEVIVVDNASTDATRVYLSYATQAYPGLRVIFSGTNAGFARACNRGVAAAKGEYIVFLNNDVVVPRGWLGRLLRHLKDPAIGLVGPVTNSVGNEARIEVPYLTLAEMETFAARRMIERAGQTFEIPMLALFCAATRRALLDEVGMLDEQFEIGLFEDDDLSQRIRLTGRRIVCAEDVFVHHVGMASFGRLSTEEYDRIFSANQRRFEAKWQTRWKGHSGRQLREGPGHVGSQDRNATLASG